MSSQSTRLPLTRDRVLRAAVDIADRDGLNALTMRRLGNDLGVEAMSLYKHVANKAEILDGIVALIWAEILTPQPTDEWKEAMRRRASSARAVLLRHSWAVGLLESRATMSPTVMAYTNAVLGNLRAAGFSIADAAHAFWTVDSYVYGHVVQEANARQSASLPPAEPADHYPYLSEVAQHSMESGFTFDQEFEYGLELILSALETAKGSGR